MFVGVFVEQAAFQLEMFKWARARMGAEEWGAPEPVWSEIVVPVASFPLVLATAWLSSRSGRFAVIIDLVVLMLGAAGGLWVSRSFALTVTLLGVVGNWTGPCLAALGAVFLYESVPMGHRLAWLVPLAVAAALAPLLAEGLVEVVTTETRRQVFTGDMVYAEADRALTTILGSVIGLGGFLCLFGLVFVRRDTPVSLVARGYPKEAFLILSANGSQSAMSEETFCKRCAQDESHHVGPVIWIAFGVLVLLGLLVEVLETAFLDLIGGQLRRTVIENQNVPSYLYPALRVGVVAVELVIVLAVRARVRHLKFLPSVTAGIGFVGTLICTSLLSSSMDLNYDSPGTAVAGVSVIFLSHPVLEWCLWVLCLDLFGVRQRPLGALAVAGLRGLLDAVLRYFQNYQSSGKTIFVIESVFVGVCCVVVLWAFYQTKWFDNSLLCVENAEEGWLESDQRMREALVRSASEEPHDVLAPLVVKPSPSKRPRPHTIS